MTSLHTSFLFLHNKNIMNNYYNMIGFLCTKNHDWQATDKSKFDLQSKFHLIKENSTCIKVMIQRSAFIAAVVQGFSNRESNP